MPFADIQDDFNIGYTPDDARALRELKVYKNFTNGDPVMFFVLIMASDGGSMSRMAHLNKTVEIIDEIGTQIRIKNQTFYDICTSFCNANEPVVQFRNGLLLKTRANGATNGTLFEDASIRYPIMTFFGHEFDLSPNFHGVETYPEGEEPNHGATNVKDLKMIALLIRAQKPDSWTEQDVINYDIALRKRYNEATEKSVVVANIYSWWYLQAEITRTSTVVFPYLAFGITSVFIFSLLSVAYGAWHVGQMSPYKLVFAVTACITPMMATAVCLGLLLWFGVRFGSILLIAPFLQLAIGVDDAYIMINAWERVCLDRKRNAVDNDTLRSRITEVMVEAGPSITVTSLTNMLAFGVGAVSSTPDIRLFCTANVLSMFLTLVFTVTFFMAALVIGAKYEMRSQQNQTKPCKTNTNTSEILNEYCKWLSNGKASVLILLMMCVYWGISIYGLTTLSPTVRPMKLLIDGSPIEKAVEATFPNNSFVFQLLQLRYDYILKGYTFVTIIVDDAGNLTDPSRRERIYSMVEQFEQLPECNGARFSHFWMRDYDNFMSNTGDVEIEEEIPEGDTDLIAEQAPYTTTSIRNFLKWPEYQFWAAFMKFDNTTDRIKNFFVTVPYHGENLDDFKEKLRMLKAWRAIADNYSDLSASVYEDDSQFTDQIETLLPRTLKSTAYSFACMFLVCALFMPDIRTVFAASVSILSIFVGVAGFLKLWNIELDPISMTTVILSIGMSVDYPAHITYHFYHASQKHPSEPGYALMARALSVIAYPLLQCCISNLLIVFCLVLAGTYVTEVIVKTVSLVVLFGSIHALVVIPAFLSAFSYDRSRRVVKPIEPSSTLSAKQ
ncbi:unnamed protein product [Anisakis simplex]|uniref:SSD domain-containing protein n=1 Tax=Anisakis simplex TaxID=6269 RepID=A0A3P6Q257_ANISI|nr:unnamed protein product [Anisakis simplex]